MSSEVRNQEMDTQSNGEEINEGSNKDETGGEIEEMETQNNEETGETIKIIIVDKTGGDESEKGDMEKQIKEKIPVDETGEKNQTMEEVNKQDTEEESAPTNEEMEMSAIHFLSQTIAQGIVTFDHITGKKLYKCDLPECKNKTFPRPSKLRAHLNVHNNWRKFKCEFPECGKTYTREQHLRRHTRLSHGPPDTGNRIYCTQDFCTQTFKTNQSLKRHIERIHSKTKPKRFACHLCEDSFLYLSEYTNHLYLSHNTFLESVVCETCGRMFDTRHEKNRHARSHRTYICEDPACDGIVFTKFNEKRKHDAVVHPLSYDCHHCGFTTKRKLFLEEHILSKHLPNWDRTLFCCSFDNCKSTFIHRRNYLSHYRTKHLNQANKLPCPLAGCPQSFTTKQSVQRHLRLIHHILNETDVANHTLGCDINNSLSGDATKKSLGENTTNNSPKGDIPSNSPGEKNPQLLSITNLFNTKNLIGMDRTKKASLYACDVSSCSKTFKSKHAARVHALKNHRELCELNAARKITYSVFASSASTVEPPLVHTYSKDRIKHLVHQEESSTSSGSSGISSSLVTGEMISSEEDDDEQMQMSETPESKE